MINQQRSRGRVTIGDMIEARLIGRARLLRKIAEDEGYGDVLDLLAEYVVESVVPGACRKCGSLSSSCEPDACNSWCEGCETNSVESIMVLAQII